MHCKTRANGKLLGTKITSYQGKHRDDPVENLLDVGDADGILETSVTDADDLVQVILDTLLGSLGSDLGAEAFEEAAKFLGLTIKKRPR